MGTQLELPVKHVYDGMPGLAMTLDRLDDLGFEVTGMFPVTRDRDLLRCGSTASCGARWGT